MITIIHGDDITKSRDYFLSEKQKIKNPVILEKDVTLSELIQQTQGNNLFFESKDVFIDNLFSSKKSNSIEFKEIINYLNKTQKSLSFFLWENKTLDKKNLLLFKNPEVKIFNLPQTLFSFLDGIKPGNNDNILFFHRALASLPEDQLLYMIVRQFRLLIALLDESGEKIDEVKRLMPWQKSKLVRQANLFSVKKLLDIYNELLKIDLEQKTGLLGCSLTQAIDNLLLRI